MDEQHLEIPADGGHQHGHRSSQPASQLRLIVTLGLIAAYAGLEVFGGWWTGSLALWADAGHMITDAGALALALFALWITRRPVTAKRTFGFYRAEILAALVNSTALIVIAGSVLWEAWLRVQAPPEVHAEGMVAIAAGGLLINLAALWLLSGGRRESLNLRGAFLHVLGDTLGSVGALVSGGLMLWQGWYWADPAASMLIALLILVSGWRLLRESAEVLLQTTPAHLSCPEITQALIDDEGVHSVHDVHLWTLSSGQYIFTAHVVTAPDFAPERFPDLPERLCAMLVERFGLNHATLQIERAPCAIVHMPV